MRDLHACLKNLKFDARMTNINLKSGQLKPDELKDHLKKLEDLTSKATAIDLGEKGSRGTDHLNGSHN